MRKLAIPIAALGIAAFAGQAQAKFHWNVKCEKAHLSGYALRGADCAHTLEPGQTWKFPKGTNAARVFTTSGKILPLVLEPPGLAKLINGTPLQPIGKGGSYGQILAGETPVWVKAKKPMVVLASTAQIKLTQPFVTPPLRP